MRTVFEADRKPVPAPLGLRQLRTTLASASDLPCRRDTTTIIDSPGSRCLFVGGVSRADYILLGPGEPVSPLLRRKVEAEELLMASHGVRAAPDQADRSRSDTAPIRGGMPYP